MGVQQLVQNTRYCPLWIVTSVLLWWTANTVTSIASKRFMIGDQPPHDDHNVSKALKDLRWIDLTFIQLAVSAIFILTWLKLCRGRTESSSTVTNHRSNVLLMASFGHMIGNLATNASYAAINSSTTQMIKACEPVFTFILLFFLKHQKYDNLSCSVLLSLLVMSAGTCLFVAVDSSFNIWGIVAALVSSFAFPIRNVYIKNLSESWESPLQQYCALSLYGLLFLFPIAFIKLLITNKIQFHTYEDILASAGSYFTYNIASIQVLQAISPLHHALLNLIKKIFAIILNVLYFSTSMHCLSVVGLVVLLTGLLLYYKTSYRLSLPRVFQSKRALVFCSLVVFSLASIGFHLFSTIPSLSIYIRRPCYGVGKESMVIEQHITSSWAYDRPLPEDVLQNVNTWHEKFPGRPVHVFCGTFSCVKVFNDLERDNTTASFLIISDLVENTIFDTWFNKHPLNKVLEGVNFVDHLQQVVSLALIWRNGGTYIDPRVKIENTHHSLEIEEPQIAVSSDDNHHNILGLFNFPKEHSFIRVMGQIFLDQYAKNVDNMKTWPMKFKFRDIVMTACKQNFGHCPKIIQLENRYLSISNASETESSFGTLSYDNRVSVVRDANLGDEIQGFPGLQFVPFINEFLERDQLHLSKGERKVTSFFNAWWGSPSTQWPPPENIDPIMLSMHIENAIKPMISKNIEYLRRKSPIGCRDPASLEFLRQQGVEAFFSGCLTLLMKNPTKGRKRTEQIYLADVNDEVRKLLPLEIQQKGILLEHNMKGASRFNKFARFKAAYDLIEKYSKAKLVVTQRIHSALPCVAMGTPVIFINSPNMPGGGGTMSESSPRTTGFHELFYVVNLYKMSRDEAKGWLHNFDWNNPHPPSSSSLLKRLRATSWNVIRKKNGLHEAALKFGVIPFPHFIPSDRSKQDLFHLIFTTKGTEFIEILSDDKKKPSKVLSMLNWRHWRCIESIFYHHPLAKVIVHSNTLPHTTFGILKESGYDIEVRRYNLKKMVNGTPAVSFMNEKYNKVKNGQYWYSHETDLLRMAILYKMGGVYMDTDVILVRSIRELPVNVVAYEKNGRIMNGAFMYFEKHHPFLNKSLEHFAKNYNLHSWAGNGPIVITNILHSKNAAQYNVSVLDQSAFYMFPYDKVVVECFQQTSGKKFEENMKIFREKAFAVHLYSKFSAAQGLNQKLKEGTICKNIFNSFCVLCDKRY